MTFDGWKISGKLTGLLYLIDFEENNTGPLLAHQDRFLSKRIKDDNFSWKNKKENKGPLLFGCLTQVDDQEVLQW